MTLAHPVPAEHILEAFNWRHATKVFDPERKIPAEQFETILEAARLSPSSYGFEPWQLLVVQSPEKRALFEEFSWGANGKFNGTPGQLGTASHFVIMLAHTGATMRPGSDYLDRHMREIKHFPDEVVGFVHEVFKTFQDVDFDLSTDRQITDWSARQAYIALGNMMTVAALQGVDSCPIEGFDVARTSAVLAEHFDVDPARLKPAVMVAFGHRAKAPEHHKTRRALSDVVRWA